VESSRKVERAISLSVTPNLQVSGQVTPSSTSEVVTCATSSIVVKD